MATRSLNKVQLIGNLTRDPELRYTPQGTAVCTFGLATNRSWQPTGGGERQEEAEFHRLVAWQKLAELCAQLLFKGRKIYVEGRLQTRNWTSKDGQDRTTTEVVIDNMIVLDSKRKDGEEGTPYVASPTNVPKEADKEKLEKEVKVTPAGKTKSKKVEEPAVKEEKEEVKADDIPF
ncbi:single-stranded DNA-binding protein [Candidatus Beckwithbacteria bacterium CG10_big_fil_rev_8_21_14_0_10_34_10]|uniref:Single-stranded DNA-binding protein n=1 Tax=Candidatus Beckwithbacteria bacterium CG10_big_fil_rev_8_21_14_0_10_34_10 TaxID=1974495 RepID=A0A2H0W8Y3_9BACT|nr:MAG: single-stranded DNA-binding protein [Candidatus Beckwithbacteria bacterium CG10_big_fil_rev_8_21_14_0_10_34_10]